MRVAYLSQGNSSHSVKWVNALTEKNCEVHFITQDAPADGVSKEVKVHRLPFAGQIGYFANALSLRRLLNEIKPDLLHSNFASGYATLARLSGFHPHLLSVWGSDVYTLPHKSPLRSLLIRSNLESADFISSTSLDMKKVTSWLTKTPIEHVPFGIDLKLFSPKPKTHEHFCFAIAKGLEPVYGHVDLISAFHIFLNRFSPEKRREFRLKIAGEGSLRPELEKLSEKLGLKEQIDFVGRLDNRKMPEFLNSVDVLMNPSHFESFGVSILEASACEIPVIATEVGGIPEVLRNHETGLLVPPNRPDQLAVAMAELYENPKLRLSLGKNGREFVANCYSMNSCTERLINLYKKIVSKPST